MNKIVICIMAVMLIFINLSGIYASNQLEIYENNESIFDMDYTENVYKFSDFGDIKLPFIRMSGERMIIDKDIYKSGISFARDNISVLNNLKGVQILTSSDTVRVTGNMEYSIIIAPTVIIESVIDKSILIVSDNLTISESAVIKEDLLCSTSKLDLLGNIEGNVLGLIEQANITGNISQDFRANVGSVSLGEGSSIQGNIYLASKNNIDISEKYPNAIIKLYEEKEDIYSIDLRKIFTTSLVFALIYLLLSCKTNIVKNMLNKIKLYKWTTFISGFANIILFPLIAIIMFVLTLIGLWMVTIPVSIVYASFMIISFMLSTFIVGIVMSEYVINKHSDKVNGNLYKFILAFVLIFVLNIITNLPIIGYTIGITLCILSTGILFTSVFRRIKQ